MIELTADGFDFTQPMVMPTLMITMNLDGRVDVQAPLPLREWCYVALKGARKVIEEFDLGDDMLRRSGYADCLPTP